jgi:hypothetical protein
MPNRDYAGRPRRDQGSDGVWRSAARGPAATPPVNPQLDTGTQPIPAVAHRNLLDLDNAAARVPHGDVLVQPHRWTALPGTPWDVWFSGRRARTCRYSYIRGVATASIAARIQTAFMTKAYELADTKQWRDSTLGVTIRRRLMPNGRMLLRRTRPEQPR